MAEENKIITRFAPSPTGDPHIGSLRNALYAWLFARRQGGRFLLRLDDTDQTRYQEGSVEAIFDMLKWVGLDYDETWRQSDRVKQHQAYAQQLLELGKAYRCFCTPERLEQVRQQQQERKEAPRYDKHCRNLSQAEIVAKLKAGEKYVIRLAIPETGETKVSDIIRGDVIFQNAELDDFIILKSDGFPTYHLASAADDNDFGVTHVIRSEEWFPSLPKHVLIYEGLGWPLPQFAHLPLILAPDKSKLSKRHGATGVLEFRQLGYLPEALLNYVLLLGWHPKQGSEKEIFDRQEMLQEFKLTDVQKGGAIFDYQKLDWVSNHYIKNSEIVKLLAIARSLEINIYDKVDAHDQTAIDLAKERINKLSDLEKEVGPYRPENFDKDYAAEILIWKKSDKATAVSRLETMLDLLSGIDEKQWQRDEIEEIIKHKIDSHDLGVGDTLWPLRVALAGQKNSWSPFELLEQFSVNPGKGEVLNRIKLAIKKLDSE